MKKAARSCVLMAIIIMAFIPLAQAVKTASDPDYPYIKQKTTMCGAASLAMAYQSFGQEITQDEVFAFTATPVREKDGTLSTTEFTNPIYKLAQDPLNRGYHAVAIEAKDPMVFFQLFSGIKDRIRVIVSMSPGKGMSHVMFLINATEKDLTFHDPAKCPYYHLTREKFIKKWEPNYGLVAISKEALKSYRCPVCGKGIPDKATCSKCGREIPLEPKEVLGCVDDKCSGRTWTKLFCPYCSNNIASIHNGMAIGLDKSKGKKGSYKKP